MTGAATFSGSGTALTGDNSFATVTFAADAAIGGSNRYAAFVCTTAGVTLTFGGGKTQTIADGGSFTVAGSDGRAVTLAGSIAASDQDKWWRLDANPDTVTVSVQFAVVSYAYSEASIGRWGTDSSEGVDGTTFNWFNGVPPSIMLTLAPVGGTSMYVVFDRALGYGGTLLDAGNFVSSGAQEALSGAFEFVAAQDAAPAPLEPLSVAAVRLVANKDADAAGGYGVLRLELNAAVTLSHIRALHLRVKTDAVQDDGNVSLDAGFEHCLSDFALNAVAVQYALSQTGASDEQAKAVRDFASGATARLLVERDLLVQVKLTEDGTNKPKNGERVKLLADTAASVSPRAASDRYNQRTGSDWRVWLTEPLRAIATDRNDHARQFAAASAGDGAGVLWNFTLPNAPGGDNPLNWRVGDEAQFIFQLLDAEGEPITLTSAGMRSAESVPLYALWLPNGVTDALPFVDLWSFGFTEPQKQRGGVTILNNVIDVNAREQTTIEVDMPADGTLNVYVLTADGNIVRRLEHGRVSGGKHYYRWNGTNVSGKAVARGIYFIRVTGAGIDETRKVLCVKE